MQTLSSSALKKVENFKVSNEFGSVEWHGETDITCLDLADIVTISQGSAEVYDDNRHGLIKPEVGQKLNKKSTITLNNIRPRANQTAEKKEQLLRKSLEKAGAEFLSYDSQRFIWEFSVFHFTKWGEEDDDDDEDEDIVHIIPTMNAPQKEEYKSAFKQVLP